MYHLKKYFLLIAVGLLAGSGLGIQNALGDTAREKTLVIAVPGTPASIDGEQAFPRHRSAWNPRFH